MGAVAPKSDGIKATLGEVMLALLEVTLESVRRDWPDKSLREEKVKEYKAAFLQDCEDITKGGPAENNKMILQMMYMAALSDKLTTMMRPVNAFMGALAPLFGVKGPWDKKKSNDPIDRLRDVLAELSDDKRVKVVRLNRDPSEGDGSLSEYVTEILKGKDADNGD